MSPPTSTPTRPSSDADHNVLPVRQLKATWGCALVGLRQRLEGNFVLRWGGIAILAVWIIWAGLCLLEKPLPRVRPTQQSLTHVPLEPFIGLDFHHNYRAVHTWRAGTNPYIHIDEDPANTVYVYPPLTLRAFAWTDLFPPTHALEMNGMKFSTSVPAIVVWSMAIVAILVYLACKAWSCRETLGLPRVPLPFLIAGGLMTYPAFFELERGNCNVLPLLLIAVIAGLIADSRGNPHRADVLIGMCVATAIGIKPYAIVLLAGLLPLRRFRAALYAVGWLLLQAIVFSPEFRQWLVIVRPYNEGRAPFFLEYSHSIIAHWALLGPALGLPKLSQLPPQPTVAAFLMVCCAVVSWPVFRRPRAGIALPFLLWLTGVGTMLIAVAWDYNLLFVPFVLLCLWSPRDPWWVQLIVVAVVVWCQPFHVHYTGLPLFLLKNGTTILCGVLLMRRVRDVPALTPITAS